MTMDTEQRLPRSYLFTIRLWTEPLGQGQVEWRGQVQHVLSGERRSFREWATLLSYLETKVLELESEAGHHTADVTGDGAQ
jgi:hypothetical protein